MLHAGRSFCLTISAAYAVCKMFSLCPACHDARRPWAGSWAPKRRTPGHNMEAPGPSWACRHTYRVTQLSAEHREGTQPQPHGWELPPCWARHSCNSTAGSPSKKRQQGPAWPPPSSLIHDGTDDGREEPLRAHLKQEADEDFSLCEFLNTQPTLS